MGIILNRTKAYIYARWGNDLRVTDYERFMYDDAVRLTDATVSTEWVELYNLPTLYASSMKGGAEGMPDKWHQLNSYEPDTDTMYREYLPDLFDWIEVPYREAPSKRWMSKCIKTIKWVESPYNDLLKVWKEY